MKIATTSLLFIMSIYPLASSFAATGARARSTALGSGSQLDAEGCRILSPLPAPGVHPRVFFTADEIPRIRDRYENSRFGSTLRRSVEGKVKRAPQAWRGLASLSPGQISDEDLLKFFKSSEGRNIDWGVVSLYAVMMEDEELKEVMMDVITNYSRVILASKERWDEGRREGDLEEKMNRALSIWSHNDFGVEVSWTLGAAGLALSYDVLYNDMSPTQRDTVRKAIATGAKGRRGYGTGKPRGFAASNHYGYHGDLLVMLSAIEGEPGYDQETYDGIRQVLTDYWDVGFTENGACHEDGYGPNLGLRAGSRGFIALARRGHNIFATQKYRNYIDWLALEFEPFPGGKFIGGASGGPYSTLYQTSMLVSRYMYPQSDSANYIFRYTFGDAYERSFRWQSLLDCLIFGGDYVGASERSVQLTDSGLKRSVFYPVRGKLISRSDWSADALQFTFDARPDAFLIGHDRVDRGNFLLSALGRMWVSAGDFRNWRSSQDHSLVHIDGRAQAYKAPSVKFLWHGISDVATAGVADLSYAYDWEWTPPWPRVDGNYSDEWQPETADPRDLGWPRDQAPDWLPSQLFGSETGYSHTNGLRRRPYNPVKQAIRATIAMHGDSPYVIIADEIQKDDKPHHYQWYMQVPTDLVFESQNGRDIILADPNGARKLLVRVLRADGVDGTTPAQIEAELQPYTVSQDRERGTRVRGQRLILSQHSIAPHFRVMLYPFRTGSPLPRVRMRGGPVEGYEITTGAVTRVLTMSPDPERGVRIGIE